MNQLIRCSGHSYIIHPTETKTSVHCLVIIIKQTKKEEISRIIPIFKYAQYEHVHFHYFVVQHY